MDPLSSTLLFFSPCISHMYPPGVTLIPFWTTVVLSAFLWPNPASFTSISLCHLFGFVPLPGETWVLFQDPLVSFFLLCRLSPHPLLFQLSQLSPQLYSYSFQVPALLFPNQYNKMLFAVSKKTTVDVPYIA